MSRLQRLFVNLCVTLLFIASSVILSSQDVSSLHTIALPEGETLVKTFGINFRDSTGKPKSSLFVVTGNSVSTYVNGNQTAVHYTPHDGAMIRAVYEKISLDTLNLGPKTPTYFCHLSDGTFEQIAWDPHTETFEKKLLKDWSEYYRAQSMVGDDMYAICSYQVYVTRDNFNSWQIDTIGLGNKLAEAMVMDSNQNMYLATYSGLFKQTHTGTVWTPIPSINWSITHLFIDKQQRLYASGIGLLFVSTDYGLTWKTDSAGIAKSGDVTNLDEDIYGTHYITTYSSTIGSHLYRQSAFLGKWELIDSLCWSMNPDHSGDTFYKGIWADSNVYVSTTYGLFSSMNKGLTWSLSNKGIPAESVRQFVKFPDGTKVMSTSLGLFQMPAKDTVYTRRYPVQTFQNAPSLFVDNSGKLYTAGLTKSNGHYGLIPGDVYISADKGVSWTVDTVGLNALTNGVFFVDANGIQHNASQPSSAGGNSDIRKKSPGGTWQLDTTGLSLITTQSPYQFGSDGHFLYITITDYKNGNHMYRRALQDTKWTEIPFGISTDGIYNMTGTKDGKLLAGSIQGIEIFDGTSWSRMSAPSSIPNNSSCYVFSTDSNNYIVAGFGSTDGSYNYTPLGIFVTADQGKTWKRIPGMDKANINRIVSFADTTYVVTNDGVIAIAFSTSSSIATETVAEQLSIYPNPASDLCMISSDAIGGALSIQVCDALGRTIQRTHLEAPQGQFQYSIDTHGLPSGVYHVIVESASTRANAAFSVVR